MIQILKQLIIQKVKIFSVLKRMYPDKCEFYFCSEYFVTAGSLAVLHELEELKQTGLLRTALMYQ